MGLYCTPKSQYTTVKHSRNLLEHTYTSDPHGLGTLTPIEFFQQDLLWQSSNTNSNSCSQKASKHTSGQSIVGTIHRRAIGPFAHQNTTSAYSPSLTCHLPAPTIECLHSNDSHTRLSSSYQISPYIWHRHFHSAVSVYIVVLKRVFHCYPQALLRS
jgi:hypothetical protein